MSVGAPQVTATESTEQRRMRGRDARAATPRSALAQLTTSGRDPLGILDRQNATREPDLLPLRAERMSADPFAFYRGTAAIMAADLARDPHSGILVASCGDAHVANFGFYASPLRNLMFDLNDFDEAAWAPWEWDVKRLIASVVIGGRAGGRTESVIASAALGAVRWYARTLAADIGFSPLARFSSHFEAKDARASIEPESRRVLDAAIKAARKRTGERATRKLTELGPDGRRFRAAPPTMVPASPDQVADLRRIVARYLATTHADVHLLIEQHELVDAARRVVGVGSVGTRCFLLLLTDPDDHGLLLQAKEATRSVLVEYGGMRLPDQLADWVAEHGQGARVVAMQRVLQSGADPFLGHLRGDEGREFYVRQFHDMKGGIDIAVLDDGPFHNYARACAAVLARAHSQSSAAPEVVGYLGGGRRAAEAILEWSLAYADLSAADFRAYRNQVASTPEAG